MAVIADIVSRLSRFRVKEPRFRFPFFLFPRKPAISRTEAKWTTRKPAVGVYRYFTS